MVRLKIIGKEIIKNVGRSESCMVSRLERSVMKRLVSELGAVATAAASKAAATAPVAAAGVDEGNGGEGNSSASSQTSKNNTACGAHELLRALVSFLLYN